jgi:hypothetical protein
MAGNRCCSGIVSSSQHETQLPRDISEPETPLHEAYRASGWASGCLPRGGREARFDAVYESSFSSVYGAELSFGGDSRQTAVRQASEICRQILQALSVIHWGMTHILLILPS